MGTEVLTRDGEYTDTKNLAWIGLQVGLILSVIFAFQLLGADFLIVAAIAFVGFLVNAMIPLRWRLPCFALVSIICVIAVLGFYNALWIFGIGGIFIGICHLPLNWTLRTLLLFLAAIGLIIARTDFVPTPWSNALYPIIAGMFMFRLIIYAYDVKHCDKQEFSLSRSVAYFFMLPNVCFPLFPIVDYKKFQSSHYNQAAAEIYQRGAKWMMRGVIHLILYRMVYQFGLLDPAEVNGAGDFVLHMLCIFALYLRISGHFHLIVGMLLLFGFNLPETHKLYFLSSSFNDFYRRINIYWKDFMMKIFYYPTYFKLRRFGDTFALVISTTVVFVVTWALHAYQWYWIRGYVLFEWHDSLFWIILASLVIVNSLIEMKKGRKRLPGAAGWTVFGLIAISCRVLATFTTIALLWSFWSAQDLREWMDLWEKAGMLWVAFAVGIPAVYLLARLFEYLDKDSSAESRRYRPSLDAMSPAANPMGIVVTCLLLLGIASPVAESMMTPGSASVVQRIRSDWLNTRDIARLERGYYENLAAPNRSYQELWQRFELRPADWTNLVETKAARRRNKQFQDIRLVRSTEVKVNSTIMTINSWGMRDKEYKRRKPPSTFRIAVLGQSHVLGSGVPQSEVFEALVESRLNEIPDRKFESYEILNFAIPGCSHTRQAHLVQDRVLDLDPDVIIYFAHHSDLTRAAQQMARCIKKDVEIPFEGLIKVIDDADLDTEGSFENLNRQLQQEPVASTIRDWAYAEIASSAHAGGVPAIFCLLEELAYRSTASKNKKILDSAKDAGFDKIWDLTDVYPKKRRRRLRVAEWDSHPNSEGHAIIADAVFELIQDSQELIPLTK